MKHPTSELAGGSAGSSRSIADAGGEPDHGPVSHSLPSKPAAIPLPKCIAAEGVRTALLLAAVGSGIMGERLANGNIAIALLANTIATGAALIALILAFGPILRAHFNPAMTLSDAVEGGISWRVVPAYLGA